MGSAAKLLAKILQGNLKNIRFAEFQKLLEDLGFQLERVSGSHHIYTHPEIQELVNVQMVRVKQNLIRFARCSLWLKCTD